MKKRIIPYVFTRNKTSTEFVCLSRWSVFLYFFSGLSLRKTSERLSYRTKRNHVSIWNWIQKYHPKKMPSKSNKVSEYIIDETLIQVGSELIWLWVAIEPKNKQILALSISKERNMFVAERFLYGMVKLHGKHPVSTDGGGTWYPQACRFLNPDHYTHFSLKKSLIERMMQYIKHRTESFDDYFPFCRLKHCKLKQVQSW